MGVIGLDAIAAVDDRATEVVDVPEWGPDAKACVGTMSGKRRGQFEDSIVGKTGEGTLLLLAYTMCDEAGAPLFSDIDAAVALLGEKNSGVLERLASASAILNGIRTKSSDEELAKNS